MDRLPQLPSPRAWVDAGVDYITCSSQSLKHGKRLARIAERLIEEERCQGEALRPFTLHSWKGYRAGRVSFAVDGHASMMRLESELAQSRWKDVYKLADNVSRIDTQYTVRFDEDIPDLASRLEAHVQDYKTFNKLRAEVRLVRSDTKGQTLYSGDRQSNLYLRTYDRYRKTKDSASLHCWRQEAEAKDQPAKRISAELYRAEDDRLEAARITSGFFAKRGYPSICTVRPCDITCNSRHTSTTDKKRLWLARQWGTFIRAEIDAGRGAQLLDALGISELVQLGRRRPKNNQRGRTEAK